MYLSINIFPASTVKDRRSYYTIVRRHIRFPLIRWKMFWATYNIDFNGIHGILQNRNEPKIINRTVYHCTVWNCVIWMTFGGVYKKPGMVFFVFLTVKLSKRKCRYENLLLQLIFRFYIWTSFLCTIARLWFSYDLLIIENNFSWIS